MASAFQAAGAQGKPTPYGSLFNEQMFSGLITNRNPLRDGATAFLLRKFYSGTRYDNLIDGLNVEMSTRQTFIRRPGLSVYNSATFPAINRFYEFRTFNSSPGGTRIIADTGLGGGTIYDATGPSTQTTVFTKSANAGNAYFQSVGNILYIGDGVDQVKYLQGTLGWAIQNWGISTNTGSGNFGPDTTGNGANGGGAGGAWTNPNNVTSAISYATVNTSISSSQGPNTSPHGLGQTVLPGAAGTSPLSIAGTFGFSIPAGATILGIQVSFTNHQSLAPSGHFLTNTDTVQMCKLGAAVGTGHGPSATLWQTFPQIEVYGSSTDLWGTTWTAADINNAGFGFGVSADYDNSTISTSYTFFGTSYFITVWYQVGTGPVSSQALVATQFGFTVPGSALLNGCAVSFSGISSGAVSLTAQLTQGGVAIGFPKTVTSLGSSPTTITLGANNDVWGVGSGLTASLVNSSTFGVQFTVQSGYGLTSIDNVQITFYSNGLPVATPTGSGTFSATVGYKYVYTYYNALSGNQSSATLPSSSTGVFTNVAYVGVTVLASPDPQVTNIKVFRTTDGGATYYELPYTFPNTTATIQDSAGDPGSTTFPQLNIFSQAPLNDYNDPPPVGFSIPAYHVGLMWGAVENVVYYSRAVDPSVLGNNVEDFPPNNYFIFPNRVVRLLPTIYGLLVFLVSDIWLIQGTGTSSVPFLPVPFVPIVGLGEYDGLTVNGALAYFMTSDNRVVSLDPNAGISEIGYPIGNLLEQFDPSVVDLTYHPGGSSDTALFITDGSTTWYRLSTVVAPEQGQMFSPAAVPNGGFSVVQSVEQTSGRHLLLVAPSTSGPILQRDLSTVADNGVEYSAYATIGSLVLAPPGQLAELGFISADYKGPASGGSIPTISVLLDDTQGTFETLVNSVNDPPTLPPSTYTVGNRWYFSQGADPAWCRHMQMKISWGATATFDEILSYTLFGGHRTER